MAEGARLESVFTRKGNVGSNPTLSATQSELQRNRATSLQRLATNCRNSVSSAFKPDWRKCPVESGTQLFWPFSPQGTFAVRFHQRLLGECNAMTNRQCGESHLTSSPFRHACYVITAVTVLLSRALPVTMNCFGTPGIPRPLL